LFPYSLFVPTLQVLEIPSSAENMSLGELISGTYSTGLCFISRKPLVGVVVIHADMDELTRIEDFFDFMALITHQQLLPDVRIDSRISGAR
jgi:hypothetical protein